MDSILYVVLGIVIGGVALILIQGRLTRGLKESFDSISLKALKENSDHFLNLASKTLADQARVGEKDLEGKKKLIDQSLDKMSSELGSMQKIVQDLEKDREKKFGQLDHQLRETANQTGRLQQTAEQLRSALASTKARGQWGERMAEDVLRLAGFVEGVNYHKNKALDTVMTRPDFTFPLPQRLKVNMDAKFPLDNYMRYLEAEGESDREQYRNQFLRDVRSRIKEVTTRDYINPEENTVDYCIVFIPNEQVYAFINDHDRTLLDEALKKKVIVCSPLTLYAILAVIRQAVDNFNLERKTGEILSILGAVYKNYEAFVKSFDKMGKRIEDCQKEFVHLTSTRLNMLERPLRKIDDLRQQKGVSRVPSNGDGEQLEKLEFVEKRP